MGIHNDERQGDIRGTPRSIVAVLVRWTGILICFAAAAAILGLAGLTVWWYRCATKPRSTAWFMRNETVLVADSDPRLTPTFFSALVAGQTTRGDVEGAIGPSGCPYTDERVHLAPYMRRRVWKHRDYFLGLFLEKDSEATSSKVNYWELAYVDEVLVGISVDFHWPSSSRVRAVQHAAVRRNARITAFGKGPAAGQPLGERLSTFRAGDACTRLLELLGRPGLIYTSHELEVWVYVGGWDNEFRWLQYDESNLPMASWPASLCCYVKNGVLLRNPLELPTVVDDLSEFDGWESWMSRESR